MRFKELRGLGLALLLFFLDICLFYLGLIEANKMKLVIAILFSFIILLNLLTQYYIRVLTDCLLVYHAFAFVLLPCLVNFKDIQEIILKSKHHIILKTNKRPEHLYVFNGQKVYEILKEREGN